MPIKWPIKTPLFTHQGHKEELLLNMISDPDRNLIGDATAIIRPYFGDCEITIVEGEEKKLKYTTILNEDVMDYVRMQMKRLSYGSDRTVEKHLCRSGVAFAEWISLPGEKDLCAVFIEFYSAIPLFRSEWKKSRLFLYYLAAVRLSALYDNVKNALSIDETTLLPTRDALIRQMELRFECNIGILGIDNYEEIYGRTKGLGCSVLQRDVASIIKEDIKMAYLIAESRFAFFLGGTLTDGYRFLQMVADRVDEYFCEKENVPVLSGVVCAQKDNPYLTLYLCETYLKKKMGKIVIARDAFDREEQAARKDISYVAAKEKVVDI